jgi:TIR domain
MADVFISYRRDDRRRIEPLARALEKCGYTVWWDLELVPSQKFERQIKSELEAAKCVIVVWTTGSVDEAGMYRSEWVHTEAESGNNRGILLPVQFDKGCTHWRHQQSQCVEMHNWSEREDTPSFQSLLRGVALHAGTRARPFDQELSAWLEAEKTESAAAFREFLTRFPTSRFAHIALSRAVDAEEMEAWDKLGNAPSVRELISFLRAFPSGRFGDEAEVRIAAFAEPPGAQTSEQDGQYEHSYGPTWRVQAETIVSAHLGRRIPAMAEWKLLSEQERHAIGQLVYEPARFDFERVKRLASGILRNSLHSKIAKNLHGVIMEIDRFFNDWAGFLVWREKESPYRDNWRAELVALRKQAVDAKERLGR